MEFNITRRAVTEWLFKRPVPPSPGSKATSGKRNGFFNTLPDRFLVGFPQGGKSPEEVPPNLIISVGYQPKQGFFDLSIVGILRQEYGQGPCRRPGVTIGVAS